MPRSKDNWSSRQRIRYIEDKILSVGHINRTMLSDYFGVEQSTGSMDIAAYIAAGGPIRRALRHETPVPLKEAVERGIGAGRPKGSQGYYVHTGGAFITDSSEARRDAWALLPHGVAGGHREWLRAVMTAWRDDHPLASPDDAMTYFGIGKNEARDLSEVFTGHGVDERRAGAWEMFR